MKTETASWKLDVKYDDEDDGDDDEVAWPGSNDEAKHDGGDKHSCM